MSKVVGKVSKVVGHIDYFWSHVVHIDRSGHIELFRHLGRVLCRMFDI